MKELRCKCNKLLGKLNSDYPMYDAGILKKDPYIIKLWCNRCKKEVEFNVTK
jgi:phage FluMu protein Com